ncbi:hypothetical protein [Clostridium thermarum]|uniref:hypothetical protein n=1 Tax=Clostridium thermarum TaxID=1716543 RepID=UPI0013CFD06B|nr:hypothetical protein [Clostridium thermarum]
MQKGKESLERKLKNNKYHTEEVSHNIEMRFKKSTHTKASAMLSGLGSDKEDTQEE